jgi:putative phage-type endonuclease
MSMDVNLIKYDTREDWLAARNLGIGASESAALFGLSPWASEFSLWAEKTGMAPREDSATEAMRWGLLLEAPIAEAYKQDSGRNLWTPPSPYCVAVDQDLPELRATPDRWIIEADGHEGRGVLEIKNVDGSKSAQWDDGPPIHVQVQVQHQLAVTGFRWAAVAALVGGNRLKSWDVERNDDFIAELRIKVREFWSRVQAKTAPTTDGSEATARALKALHPRDNGCEVKLPDESATWWAALEAAKDEEKGAKARKTDAENKLRAAIGDATFGVLPDGRRIAARVTEVPGRTQVVEPCSFRALRIQETKPQTKKGSKR